MYKKVLFTFMSLLLIVSSLCLTSCSSTPATELPTSTAPETLLARVTTLEQSLANLKTTVEALPTSSGSSAAVTQMQTEIGTLASEVSSLRTQLTTLKADALVRADIRSVENQLTSLQDLVYGLQGEVNVLQGTSDYDDLEVRLNALDDVVISFTESLSRLDRNLDTLSQNLAALSDRVTELHTTPTTVPAKNKSVEIEVVKYSDPYIDKESTSATFLFKLNVTNTGKIDLHDVGIVVNFFSGRYSYPALTVRTLESTPSITWNCTEQTSNILQFVSGWGAISPSKRLTLIVGETKSYYVTLRLEFEDPAAHNYDLAFEVFEGYLE